MVIARIPGHPPGPEFGMYFPTISPEVLPCPKGSNLIDLKVLSTFGGVIKVHNPINRGPYNPLKAAIIRQNRLPWDLT